MVIARVTAEKVHKLMSRAAPVFKNVVVPVAQIMALYLTAAHVTAIANLE